MEVPGGSAGTGMHRCTQMHRSLTEIFLLGHQSGRLGCRTAISTTDSSKADFKYRIYHQSGYTTKLPLCLCPIFLRSSSVTTPSLPSIIGKRTALLSFVPISDCTQVYARTRALKPALYACPMQAFGIGTAHRHYARARSSTQRLHVYSRVAPMGVHVRERTALASSSLRARFKGQTMRA